jgi:hypothetical protein
MPASLSPVASDGSSGLGAAPFGAMCAAALPLSLVYCPRDLIAVRCAKAWRFGSCSLAFSVVPTRSPLDVPSFPSHHSVRAQSSVLSFPDDEPVLQLRFLQCRH